MSAVLASLDPRLEHLFALREPLLKALRQAGDTHTVGDIAEGVLLGRYQYWQSRGAGIITEIVEYPRKRTLHYFLVFGELEACLAMQEPIEVFARAEGCSIVTCAGRPGWKRILPKSGWRDMFVVMAKDL